MLDLSLYEFHILAQQDLHLASFSGTTLRGGLGAALKRLVCATGMDECRECPLLRSCPFTEVFNVIPADDDPFFKNETDAPRPFVISPPHGSEISRGQVARFGLVLAGRAAEQIPLFIMAYKHLGETGIGRGQHRFKLLSVTSVNPWNPAKVTRIFDGTTNLYFANAQAQPISLESIRENLKVDYTLKEVSLVFDTPTRINSTDQAPGEAPSFRNLIKAILRRYSALAALYGEGRPEMDYKAIVAAAGNVRLRTAALSSFRDRAYSRRKRDFTPIQGITGRVTYEGDVAQFLPFLAIGQWMHVGKQATFGLGRYKLEVVG